MAYEKKVLVTRTIYVATCQICHERVEHTEKIAKERFCQNCGMWIPFVEQSYTGPELGKAS